ncbi:MAG: pyruvate dehydrogenase complex dihydrolipoamide acetyltransferase [Planktomarina temperata]|jgi:pyruvate dehydrogenase E2 component (dihydrolipoamide acetyltransferase)|uniref:pyruvate dehydrogenase complex dihydrolipoamide acetyltransferase n=2 Tax=Planktomarina TaxID=1284657 RepID=UPI000E97C9C6|nr:pyruvate dehydrogenase complex dihydrolipoamide acetyltransferase [Planktomarina temperata]MDB0017744.1 pyruvate dehydrogenase complex dihydrolipoamide acetyltransferase [Planktomarina temperata]MDB2397515.1 pyruvate dehydrogenase complex dihydrolipoamide acetyltransferase [Planktomarina temperata]MDB2689867.1 pyruvate dehydrogenase complex dihydrolipoamide acetyltransferase [Planktomarina temperata]MDC1095216.1 pyruvate dehydrogenase complex dihydrolipoamide acetyltransferase [Planktomarina
MALEILMPALSPTMEEGTLAKWLVAEGDRVQSGDLLAEIETDKATMEFEAVDEGVIGKLLVAEGTANVKVNSAIAILLEEGDAADATVSPAQSAAAAAPLTHEASAVDAPAATAAPAAAVSNDGTRIFASPLARRIAADQGLDLAKITGSGPKGRIVKADVSGAPATASVSAPPPMAAAPAASLPSSASVEALYQGRSYKTVPLDGMRRVIADRLTEAKQTIPHFYLRRDIQLDTLLKLRSEVNAGLEARGVKLSVNDFIIKACAMALQSVPAANAVWAGDRVLQMEASDISVAVAIEGGLFTPVLQDADSKSLSKLAVEMKDLAARARSRKLAPHEYQGGSFSISNLGMMGIDNFDAVINPPQGAILAVGAGKKRPVVSDDGTLSVATVMSVTMSVDHRVIDGALGAELLDAIVNNLEHPLSMLA